MPSAFETLPECLQRAITAGLMGMAAGGFAGSVTAAWIEPQVPVGGRVIPVLRQTGGVIGRHMGILGAVGVAFAGVHCLLESVNPRQMVNGMLAGCAAGVLLGLERRSVKRGVQACAAIAAVSAGVDYFDGRARPDLRREKFFPYHGNNDAANANQDD